MDYEKKYKELVGKIEKAYLYAQTDSTKAALEEIRPELAESRIRKDVKRAISVALDYSYFDEETANNCLSWLEKQKDYVPPQMVADAYLRGCNDTEKKWLEKQGQSFPILSNSAKTGKNWTEEDERGSDETIELLEYFINYTPEFRRPAIRRSIDWLQSLKQRMEE